jgi:2-methylcitrate dehydratase PrpD
MQDPGIGFKKYACCFAMHRAIDAMERLRADGVLGGGVPVARISARVAPGALKPLIYDRPVNGLEGKFSMNYALAVGVLDGDFSLAAFTDAGVARAEIRSLLELTHASEDPECSPGDPEGRTASAGTRGFVEVTVELTDGRRETRQVTIPPGAPARPISDDELRAKFRACASFAGLRDERAEALLDRIETIADAADISGLVDLLAGEAVAVEAR